MSDFIPITRLVTEKMTSLFASKADFCFMFCLSQYWKWNQVSEIITDSYIVRSKNCHTDHVWKPCKIWSGLTATNLCAVQVKRKLRNGKQGSGNPQQVEIAYTVRVWARLKIKPLLLLLQCKACLGAFWHETGHSNNRQDTYQPRVSTSRGNTEEAA